MAIEEEEERNPPTEANFNGEVRGQRFSFIVIFSSFPSSRPMAMRSVLTRFPGMYSRMEGSSGSAVASTGIGLRFFSDKDGRVLSEEEKAAENVYIKKMERERAEKAKLKAEKDKAEADKSNSSDKKS